MAEKKPSEFDEAMADVLGIEQPLTGPPAPATPPPIAVPTKPPPRPQTADQKSRQPLPEPAANPQREFLAFLSRHREIAIIGATIALTLCLIPLFFIGSGGDEPQPQPSPTVATPSPPPPEITPKPQVSAPPNEPSPEERRRMEIAAAAFRKLSEGKDAEFLRVLGVRVVYGEAYLKTNGSWMGFDHGVWWIAEFEYKNAFGAKVREELMLPIYRDGEVEAMFSDWSTTPPTGFDEELLDAPFAFEYFRTGKLPKEMPIESRIGHTFRSDRPSSHSVSFSGLKEETAEVVYLKVGEYWLGLRRLPVFYRVTITANVDGKQTTGDYVAIVTFKNEIFGVYKIDDQFTTKKPFGMNIEIQDARAWFAALEALQNGVNKPTSAPTE